MLTIERENRDVSYYRNLEKEARLTQVFIRWCQINKWRYRINPTDSSLNKKGSDVTICKNGRHLEIDLKGCMYKYGNVALSYKRSYDNIHWFSTLDTKITNCYVFIDELDNIYSIALDDIKLIFDDLHKTEVDKSKAGHYQKCILIPKDYLQMLN